jgi:hypothetical protein
VSHCSVIELFSSTGFKRPSAELQTFKPVFLIEVSTQSPHPLTILTLWTFHTTRHFYKGSHKMGYSPGYRTLLDYAEILYSNDVPVIYNSAHLSRLVGYKRIP